ncbi:ABC-2 transporter permease [Paenibacillus beijingensis]|uniref:ABC transporter, permease n=1 Tax=Paenibacillus beijingensis TaxID=1126833 RepID=A0A0D5NH05_9BACL|nr:ABC-2 transporter permease [Paenibacillus beijingensis]AJY74237.1 ABC transporter, permease [Paenibacillus beijingensis]
MFGLMIKDFYTQRKFAYLAPIFLLPYFLTLGRNISGAGIELFSLSIGFIGYIMTLYSNFNIGESEKMQNRLLISLPTTRTAIIFAKYVMISFWWLISYISYVVLLFVLERLLHYNLTQSFDIRIAALSLCATYLFASIFYPFHFKFGYRAASLLGIAMFFLVTNGMGKLFSLSRSGSWGSAMADQPILSFAVITLSCVLVSYLLSVRIFSKKDF